ncbi:MAG: hypothetical protein N3E49_09160 [Bacteroidia bacterium]|nr:hypothetical protein [Bacteroidia bacterium]
MKVRIAGSNPALTALFTDTLPSGKRLRRVLLGLGKFGGWKRALALLMTET